MSKKIKNKKYLYMEPERLQLACEGKTRSQGGLNVDELEEITGLHGVSRDRLVEEVCKMAEDHPVKQKQQQQRSCSFKFFSLIILLWREEKGMLKNFYCF